jgi:hypothetical protein
MESTRPGDKSSVGWVFRNRAAIAGLPADISTARRRISRLSSISTPMLSAMRSSSTGLFGSAGCMPRPSAS